MPAFVEALQLHLAADVEPELEEHDAVVDQQASRSAAPARGTPCCSSGVQNPMTGSTPARLYQERSKMHDFAGGRQLGDVALEIPLAALGFRRLRQRDDRAPCAGSDTAGWRRSRRPCRRRRGPRTRSTSRRPVVDDMMLQLDQFDLQRLEVLLILLVLQRLVIGIAAGPEGALPRPSRAGPGRRGRSAELGLDRLGASLGRARSTAGMSRRLAPFRAVLGLRFAFLPCPSADCCGPFSFLARLRR